MDTTPVSATLVTPKQFDLFAPGDVTSAVTLNDATSITSVTNVATPLTLTTDYTFAANTLTINQSYLTGLPATEGVPIVLTVAFNVGDPAVLTINVVDTTPIPLTVHVTDSGTLIAAGIDPAVGTIILDNTIGLAATLILNNGAKTVDLNGQSLTVAGNPIIVNANGSKLMDSVSGLDNGIIDGAVVIGGTGTGFSIEDVTFNSTIVTSNSAGLSDNISFLGGSIVGAITSTVPAKQYDGTALTAAITPGTGTVLKNLTIAGAVTASSAATYQNVVFNGAVTASTVVSTFTPGNIFNASVTNLNLNSNYTGSTFNGPVTNTNGDANYTDAIFNGDLTITAGSPILTGATFALAVTEADKITEVILGTITVGDASTVLQKAQALVGAGYTVAVKATDGVKINGAGVAISAGAGTISFTVTKNSTPFITADTPTLNITVNPTYTLRSTGPGGGLIFYIAPDGLSGLEAAPTDQSAGIEWITGGSTQTTLNGNTGTAVGTGQANTNAMIAQTGYTGGAAQVCNDLVSGGKDDWFLPSQDELYLMYTQLKVFSVGNFTTDYYWSSSEFDATHAWIQDFVWGDKYSNIIKGTPAYYVRAVRAF